MPDFMDLDAAAAFERLTASPPPRPLAESLSAERVRSAEIGMGAGLVFNYAAAGVEEPIVSLLQELADEMQVIDKYLALVSGQAMNTGEGRSVLHHLTRGQVAGPVILNGRDYGAFYNSQRQAIAAFCDKVHSGQVHGSTGQPFASVCQIGIGGSDLGPRALYLALEAWAAAEGSLKMGAHFISNVDPDDAYTVLSRLDPATTLFILVSKSGTTQETLANETLVRSYLEARGLDPSRHMLAVTSETSPLARNPRYLESFYIDDFIGGRYSSTSAVGGAVLSLAFGPQVFTAILNGAHQEDILALDPRIERNPALMDALIGLYHRNILGYPCTAILPYSQALSRFPAHLQQLDMESNGKSVNRDGRPVNYPTGPVVLGEPGTNGQHSFYQLLHQGTDIVPLQFIGFRRSQGGLDVQVEGSTSQAKLNANLAAQITAFAKGKPDLDANRNFPGDRPSTLIHGERLTPEVLGALLAHFENKVMFQGFLWNINSFDQEGVQLGKVLAKQVLSGGPMDGALAAYASLLKA
jgi:glucose-6-phosphate isomerase